MRNDLPVTGLVIILTVRAGLGGWAGLSQGERNATRTGTIIVSRLSAGWVKSLKRTLLEKKYLKNSIF